MFLTIVLGVWTMMHVYVFWRAASVPAVVAHVSRGALVAIAVFLWLSYPLARLLDHWRLGAVARPLEFAGYDVDGHAVPGVRGPGRARRRHARRPPPPPPRPGAARLGAGGRGGAGGRRAGPGAAPAGRRRLRGHASPGSPPERDGTVLVELSDLHLGTLIGEAWMARLVDRVDAMKPDLIVVDGDLIDGNVARVEPMVPVLRRLRRPARRLGRHRQPRVLRRPGEEREAVRGRGLPRPAGPLGRGRPRPRARRGGRPHRPPPVRPRRRAGRARARGPAGRRHRAALAHAVASGAGGGAWAPA